MSQSTSPKQIIGFAEFVTLMALYMAITALSIDTVLPALSLIGDELKISHINHSQYVISFLFLGLTVGQIIYGPLADSFGRKKSVYAGMSLFLAGCALSYISHSFELMLAGRFLQGMGAAATRIVSVAIVRDTFHGREMARVMSFAMAIFIFVPAIAPTIGEIILSFASWHSIFLLFMLVACIIISWTHFRIIETLKPEDKRPFELRSIAVGIAVALRTKITLCYTICAGLIFGTLVGFISSARQIFQDYYHAGEKFALYFALTAMTIGAASIVNSQIVRHLGMRRIASYGLLGMIVSSAAFLAALALQGFHAPLWQFMLYMPSAFFFLGLLFGNFNALAMEPMGHMAGIGSAVVGCLSSAISLVLGTLIGQAYNDTLIPLTLGFLSLSLIALVLHRYASRYYVEAQQ